MKRSLLKKLLLAISAGSLSGCVSLATQALYGVVQPLYGVQTPPPDVQAEYAAPQVKYGAPWVGQESFQAYPVGLNKPEYVGAIAARSLSSIVMTAPLDEKCVTYQITGGFQTLEATGSQFNKPEAIAYDASGSILVVDSGNNALWQIADGIATQSLGPETLSKPEGVAAASGSIYVSDTAHHRILKLDAQGQCTVLAGTGTAGFADGSSAQFNNPTRLVVALDGTVYVADSGNHRIRKIAPDGTVSTLAGTGVAGFSGDGYLAQNARLNSPRGLALDDQGHLYVADVNNQKVRVINLNTQEIASLDVYAQPNWSGLSLFSANLTDLCVIGRTLLVLETDGVLWHCTLP